MENTSSLDSLLWIALFLGGMVLLFWIGLKVCGFLLLRRFRRLVDQFRRRW